MEMVFIFFLLLLRLSAATTDVASCSCGFVDSRTGAVWTDAIITYANETDTLPADSLVAEDFQHPYEKNWNARYRAGGRASNLGHNASSASGWEGNAWSFNIDRPSPDHSVVGASIRTLRRDIRYGTFEAMMGAPVPGVGGSVFAMRLDYNESQTINLNMMNADDPKDAWTSFMVYGDWRGTRSKGVNWTDFGNSTYGYQGSPWGFVPYRIDWNDTQINYFIGDALARSIISPWWKAWPSTASTLRIRHSSIGDSYTSEGPPPNGSTTHLGLIRAFFNSSLMSDADHHSFDKRCGQSSDQCLVTDMSLRGSSPYSHNATIAFKEPPLNYKKRWPAIFIACICISISTLLLIHALLKRAPWTRKAPAAPHGTTAPTANSSRRTSNDLSVTPSMIFSEGDALTYAAQYPATGTPGQVTPGQGTPGTQTPRHSGFPLPSFPLSPWSNAGTLVGEGGYFTLPASLGQSPAVTPGVTLRGDSRPVTRPGSASLQTPRPIARSVHHRGESDENTVVSFGSSSKKRDSSLRDSDIIVIEGARLTSNSSLNIRDSLEITTVGDNRQGYLDGKKLPDVTVKEVEEKKEGGIAGAKTPIAPPKQRVDYLAGLVALASVLVTLIHFCLTFLPATEIPYSLVHYESEVWALKIIAPYLLTFSWIGPFFTSSTRFLVGSYLMKGNLKGVAEKVVGRTPRLIIPCAAIAALEYFCMQVGATTYLEYLPSITYSTWPYTSGYVDFGHFISEVIELMYIIPNAVPQITFNYCIGVLWTIPVQLQNSWLSLLAVIVIREIKTPWKRMSYYAFCILMHYYAMSWGSFFWVGLLIADLDLTYAWKKYLYARPLIYYPLITFITLLAVGSPSIDLVGQWTSTNFNTLEFGIHPQQRTAHPIRDTPDYGYPPYYLPRLTALTFSIGFHLLVELSPLVQKFFSNAFLMWLFPHILTLYLIHGLVFWSLGATVCVHLAALGIPYWANMLVVATSCYIVIFGCLPFLTPVIETLGKSITVNIWLNASGKPPPRRKTLFPFGAELLKDGVRNDTQAVPETDDVERNEKGVAL